MDPYLPHLTDILALCVTWAVGGSLLLAGAGLTGNRGAPEFQIAAGWGALCLLLTSWGVFVPLSMQLPAVAFGIGALTIMLVPKLRPSGGAWLALGRMLAVSLPLWLVVAPLRPSQPDTFLNLLPNVFYLVDYGLLPTATRPPSYSLLPAAPYNTQFLSFLGSLLDADYPAPGMSLVNVMLQLVAGLAIARALGQRETSSGTAPGWGLTALGFLLATLFNPGFVPRIHFAAYGEPALAAMAVLAAWLFVLAQGELAEGNRPAQLLPLALALAAIANAKQTGIALVAALAGAALISAWAERRVQLAAALRGTVLAVLPALFLFAIWRYHVGHAGVDELTAAAFWRLELDPSLGHGGERSRRRIGKAALLRLRRRCDPGPAAGVVAAGLDGHLSTSDIQRGAVRPLQHIYFHDLYCRISDRDEQCGAFLFPLQYSALAGSGSVSGIDSP